VSEQSVWFGLWMSLFLWIRNINKWLKCLLRVLLNWNNC
jgi:hypothetical protein